MEVHNQVRALEEEIKRLRALVVANKRQSVADTKGWKPETGQAYFYITDCGTIKEDIMSLDRKHKYRLRLSNVFKTTEIAKMAVKSNLAKIRIHEAIDLVNQNHRETVIAANGVLEKLNLFITYSKFNNSFHCVVGYDTVRTYDGYVERPYTAKKLATG